MVYDDEPRRAPLRAPLTAEGYKPAYITQNADIAAMMTFYRPELVLIALGQPSCIDCRVVREVRAMSDVPLIVLIEGGRVDDRLTAFECGADDCLDAPFADDELVARMAALMRRSQSAGGTTFRVGDLIVDVAGGTAVRADHELDLTPKEFALLAALAERAGQLHSAASLRRRIWPDSEKDSIVHTQISGLRRKLEAHGSRLLHSSRGAGYVLRADG